MALADVISSRNQAQIAPASYEAARPVLKWVYTWMFFGLFITAAVAWAVSTNEAMLSLLANPVVMIIAIVAQLGIVIGLSAALPRLSPGLAAGLFMFYAGLMGFTLSTIFIVFSLGTIATAFLSAASLFAVMTVFAFRTKTDLSKFGSYLMIGLIALIIASVINIFIGSGALAFLISIVGVILFLALTAYDTQNIQRMAAHPDVYGNPDMATKIGIFGALSLYLNFINIFLFLLQIFGGGSNE